MKPNTSFIFLAIASVLFSLDTPVLQLLILYGARVGIHNTKAISFCNILFIGNLFAVTITAILYRKIEYKKIFRTLTSSTVFLLLISSFLNIITASLIYFALERTTVVNVVLISRFEALVYATVMVTLSGTWFKKYESIGYGFIIIGIAFVLLSRGSAINTGDYMVLGAATFAALSLVVAQKLLERLEIPFMLIVRDAISTIIFYVMAVSFYGHQHFADAFHGDLLLTMLIYTGLIIVLGKIFWFKGLVQASTASVSNFVLMQPVFAMIFAYLLLQQTPDMRILVGVIVLAMGIGLTKIKPSDALKMKKESITCTENSVIGQ